MKNAILILFCLFFFIGYSQERNSPYFYLNGKEMDFENVFINPMNIDSLFVEKKTKAGEIYVVTKKQIEFINLDSFLQNYPELDIEQNKILFIIENKKINNESKVLIDKTYFLGVKIDHLDDVDYLDESFKKLIIVNISLKTKREIIIRGESELIEKIINK